MCKLITSLFMMLFLVLALFIIAPQPTHAVNCDGLQLTGDLPTGTYTLTDNCLTTGTLNIQAGQNVIVNGNGYIIDGNNTHRVLLVNTGGQLILNNITIRNGASDVGGGIHNDGGTLIIDTSTFSGNTATNWGGGIRNNGGIFIINNSTFSGNTATVGGGVDNAFGTTTINNSTFSGNTATAAGGGIANAGGIITLTNSIVSANNGGGCSGTTITDGGGNLVNIANGGACVGIAPHVDADPMLGGFNGSYFPLLDGSPAINGAPTCASLTNDQIGTPRPQGVACDIGAIEVQINLVTDEVIQPSIPSLNQWNGEYPDEIRAEAYGVADNVYATVHMQNGAWQYTAGAIPKNLIEYGVVMAIDVWEQGGDQYFETYQRVCLLGEGRLIYFDATLAPRPMVEIPTDYEDGYTCGWIPNAGTLVLINSGE